MARWLDLWKLALTATSKDEGRTWTKPIRAPKFVNSNAKIWGQKTSDGKYATVYNPSEFRWPLGISTSADGLNYTNLLLVNGEISGMRYGGAYKSYGPQYTRGIIEGNGTPPDKNMWVTYSMNKEDIWVSSIPVPVKDKADGPINDVFNDLKDGEELNSWNTFSPVWAQVSIEKMKDGTKALSLKDADLFDYAKAEHLFPETKKVTIEFSVTPMQFASSNLQVEVQDAKGTPCTRLIFAADSAIYLKVGYRLKRIGKYKAGEECKIKLALNTEQRMLFPTVDGKEGGASLFFAPLESVQKLVFRTGDTRRFPDAETPTDQNYDVPKAGEKDIADSVFY